MKVEVIKPHRYDGVNWKKGDTYDCAQRFVKALTALGRVKVATEEPPPAPKRAPRARVTTQRTYQRRDMQAGD